MIKINNKNPKLNRNFILGRGFSAISKKNTSPAKSPTTTPVTTKKSTSKKKKLNTLTTEQQMFLKSLTGKGFKKI
jgi:hypothetical protein